MTVLIWLMWIITMRDVLGYEIGAADATFTLLIALGSFWFEMRRSK